MRRLWIGLAVALASAAPLRSASGRQAAANQATPAADALALIQTLNTELLASRSATATLERWCRDRQLADDPTVVAKRIRGDERPPTTTQREHLGVDAREPIVYRHVELRCGDRVLSDAENWYVPARLTPDMNRALDTTDTPFGTVVRPLDPYRETLTVTMFWPSRAPATESGARAADRRERSPADARQIPAALFEHRALVYARDHTPFAEVREVYQRGILPGVTVPR